MAQRLCSIDHVPETGKEVFLDGPGGGTYLLLIRRDGDILAWHNACPHQGRALNWAADRFLFDDDGRLVCPHHGATFELPSGDCIAGPCQGERLKRARVEMRDDALWFEEPTDD